MKKTFLYILLMVITATVFGQNVYVVTKTTDPNPFTDMFNNDDALCDPDMYGTLQWAINKVNYNGGESRIEFNIPGTGVHEISSNSYFPQITRPVIIDGTTQPGYNVGNPVVKITGQMKTQYGFNVYNTTVTIKGLHISNFANSAILLTNCSHSKIIDNKICNIASSGNGLQIFASNYTEIYGNRIEIDALPSYVRSLFGVYIDKSEYCIIGSTEQGKANTIANCYKAGVYINGYKFNKVSGNIIYNNPAAILLGSNANDNIQPPVITSYTNGILSGTALPNSTVEIFGSTGAENANEYLVSVVADGSGDWISETITLFEYFVTTLTDVTKNSSLLSGAFHNTYLNPGITCETAIELEADTATKPIALNISRTETWLKYSAISAPCLIEINTANTNLWQIEEIYLYSGVCDSLVLIEHITTTQSDSAGILIYNYDAIPDHTYYLKIVHGLSSVNSEYLIDFISTMYINCNDENIQCFVCNNLIPNNSFELFASSYIDEKPFTDGFVCCGWQTAFGSPQIKEGEMAGTNSAHMWLSNYSLSEPESFCIGEGIFVNIGDIEIGEEYLLNFKYKLQTLEGNTYDVPYSELRVLLTNENTFNVDMQIYGSAVPDYDDFNNTDYQILFDNPQISDDNWVDVYLSFQAAVDFETLLIYPYFNSDYLDWIVEEDLSVTGFFIDNISIKHDPGFELYEDSFCNNETEVQLEANPVNGTWSGAGVLSPNGLFNPSLLDVGESSVYYTYTYLDNNNNECEITTEFQINILPGPKPPVFDVPECLFKGIASFNFEDLNNSEDLPFGWTWVIGNSSTIEGQNISYTFPDYGYYCINLKVSSEQCGTSSYSEIVYVNNEFCACSQNEHGGGLFNYTYNHGYTIFSNFNETWSSSENIYVEGDIHIQDNAILTIGDDSHVEFAPNGRLIVEAGGKLIIGNNVTLTSIYEASWAQQAAIDNTIEVPVCNFNMWQGIEVWGDNDFPHVMDKQGIVEIIDKNNVVIENAHIGILSGARNMDYICNSVANPDPYDSEKGCGLIQIAGGNTTFKNNGTGIKFLPREPIYSIGAFWSGNVIEKCTFETTDQNLNDIHYSTLFSNPYPNPQNPWAGYANEYKRTDVGIYINGIKGLDINECTFIKMQYGILSYDSKFNVQNNSHFTNMIYGIRCENTYNSIINSHEISQCYFDKIPGYVDPNPDDDPESAAIYIKAGYNDYIHNNTFGDPATIQKHNHFGIITSSSSIFEITENRFRNFDRGIVTTTSGINGGFIGAENNSITSWNGNEFTHSWRSITTQGYNPMLRLRCNTSINDEENTNAYDVNYLNTGTLANQGKPTPLFSGIQKQRYPAGNIFLPNDNDYKTISSYNSYIYYRHIGPSQVIPVVDPNSEATININSTNAVFKFSNTSACPDPFWGHIVIGGIQLPQLDISLINNSIMSYPFSIVDSLQNISDSLTLVRNNLNINLDDGKTAELLNDIYGNMAQGRLKNKLIAASPLSDTVIYALLTEYPLSHGNFKNVILLNLPVNQNLENLLYTVLTQIPSGISNQLIEMQAYNPFANTPGKLEQEIKDVELEKQLLLNRFIRLLTDTAHNRYEDAIRLLEAEQNVASDKILTGTYISIKDYNSADEKILAIPNDGKDNEDFKALNDIVLSYYEQGKSLFELDSTELEFLWQLAYECPLSLSGANAQSVLSLLYRTEFEDCPPAMGTRNAKIYDAHLNAPEDLEEFSLGDNYPDPADNYTIIPYNLGEEDGILVISDASGKEIYTTKLYFNEHEFFFNTQNLVPGIYNYTIILESGKSTTKKFAIYR